MRALYRLTLCLILGSVIILAHCSSGWAQPNTEQLEAARAIRTVRLEVDQRLIKKLGLELPFEETARLILAPAGLTIVGREEPNPDAILKVKARLQEIAADTPPSKEEFGPHGPAGTLVRVYFGARVFGDLTLEQRRPNRTIHRTKFDSQMQQYWRDQLSRESDLAREAFFARGSFACTLATMVYELYGPDALIQVAQEVQDYLPACGIAEAWVLIGPDAIEPLITCLSTPSERARERAAWALGELKDKRAVPKLIEALNDHTGNVSRQAALALGKIGDERAIGPLIDAYIRGEGSFALFQLTGQSFGDDYVAWRKWWEATKR